MSNRLTAWLAWLLWGLDLLVMLLSLVLVYRARVAGLDVAYQGTASVGLFALEFATIGALIVLHRSGNPIGWLFCVIGAAWAIQSFAPAYARYALLAGPQPRLGGVAWAWINSWFWFMTLTLGTFLLMLFPNGQLLSRRWWLLPWTASIATVLAIVARATHPQVLAAYPGVHNPLAIGGSARTLLAFLGDIGTFVMLGTMPVAAVSLILRVRHSRGAERQQMKVFAYGAGMAGCLIVVGFVIYNYRTVYWAVGWLLILVAIATIPLAAAIAILKYHLYDIDIIIRRTLLYTVLSLTLVLVYFGSVVVLETLLRGLTGQGQNQLVTALSTLAIAALFTPLRRRVQNGIDRRFYRRKYNVEQVLTSFSETVRNETDLEKLNERLIATVKETLQPVQASLWLRALPREVKQ
jgi:hypothetical protein